MLAPALPGGVNHELHALALLMRDWADDPLLAEHALVTVLITESLNDLQPLLASNPRAAKIKLPLPSAAEIAEAVSTHDPAFPKRSRNAGASRPSSPRSLLALRRMLWKLSSSCANTARNPSFRQIWLP